MSKPRYIWWGYALNIVRSYPELYKAYKDLHSQRVSSNLSGVPGAPGHSRGVEITALKQLPPARQKEYDAVTKAIEITKRYKNGSERIEIINLVYWKKTHNLEGAALQTSYSYVSAKRFHKEFITLIGFLMGLEDDEAC